LKNKKRFSKTKLDSLTGRALRNIKLRLRGAHNIDALRNQYDQELPARVSSLDQLWQTMQHRGYELDQLNALAGQLVALRGSMTTFGYPIKGASLLFLEELVKSWRVWQRVPTEDEKALFGQLIHKLKSTDHHELEGSRSSQALVENTIPTFPTELVSGQVNGRKNLSVDDYESLLSNMPGVAYRCLYDPDWTQIYFSSNCHDLTGYTREELGKDQPLSYGDLIFPDDQDMVYKEVTEAIEEKRQFELTYRIQCRDGSMKWVWERGHAIYRRDGTVAYLEGFNNDFTRHQQIREGMQSYKSLVAASTDYLALLDTNYIYQVANDAYAAQFGKESAQLVGRSVAEILGPNVFADRKPLLDKCMRGERVHAPLWVDLKLGGPHYLDVIYEPSFDSDGAVVGLVVSARDLSQLKRAEEAAAQSDKQVRMLLDCSAEAIYGIDMEGNCTFVNKSCLRLLGYSSESDFLGKNMHEMIHHHYPDGTEAPIEQCQIFSAFHKGEPTHRSDEVFWHQDGYSMPVEYWSYPVVDQGKVLGAVVNFIDITERLNRMKALQLSESHFRTLAELSPVGIYRSNEQGVAIYANDAIAEMVGLPLADCLGSGWVGSLHPEDRARVPKIWQDAVSHRKKFSAEYRFVHADGAETCCIGEAVPEYNADGEFIGYIGTLVDLTDIQLAQKQLAHFGRILDDSVNEIYVFDATTLEFIYVNQGAKDNLGYADDELAKLTPIDLKPELSVAQLESLLAPLRCGEKERVHFETVHRRKDGSDYPIEVYLQLSDYAGRPAFHAVIQDITERLETEQHLQQYAAIFNSTSEAMMITDSDSRIIEVNHAFERVTGYSGEDVLGNTPALLKSGKHEDGFYDAMWEKISETGNWRGEIWNQRKSGEVYPGWLNINAIYNSRGDIMNYIGVFADISMVKESEEQLDYLAHHDPLTSLPNRLLFQLRLEQAMKHARRNSAKMALIYLDLDRFKQVNDSLGHHIGDLLLIEAAKRIVAVLRAEDTVARLGGDEFAVILDGITNEQQLPMVAKKIVRVLSSCFEITDYELYVSASVGIAIYPKDGETGNELTKNADMAMYHAKHKGRNTFQFYDIGLNRRLKKRMSLETDLHRAIERDQLSLHYQPQFFLNDYRLIGAEALIRWEHPERGLIMPGEFIKLAEECGLIYSLNEWVLRRACDQHAQWVGQGCTLGRVAVNISGGQFERIGLIDKVKTILQETGTKAESLELEIVEDFIMHDETKALKELSGLAELGVSLAIDDFGTGHTSLSYLKKLPVDRLKLDRSFVKDLLTDSDDQAITQSIIALGRHMSMEVVAEGVELREQRNLLSDYGCQVVQGYACGKPVPAEDFYQNYLN